MVIGTTLLKLDGVAYYSPQFNRGGNGCQFTVDVLNYSGATGFDITIEHKNASDTSWTTLTTFTTITTTGIYSQAIGGIKEQLRFKYTITALNAYNGVHFNLLAPQWKPY